MKRDYLCRPGFRYPLMAALLALFFIAGALQEVSAQTDFSGSWKLKDSSGGPGEMQGLLTNIAPQQMNVSRDGDEMAVEKITSVGSTGERRTTNEKYDLKGGVTNNPISNNPRRSTVRWSPDNERMTIRSDMSIDMQGLFFDITQTEVWSLSDDGKTLRIEMTMSTSMGDMSFNFTYEKSEQK